MGGGLEQAGAVGDGVEEARGRHPACRLGILGHHTGKLRAFLGSGAGKRRIEHARITLGQAPALKQRIEIGQGPAVDGRAGHVMGGEIGRDGADLREQPGQRVTVPLGGDAACALGRETGEADRAAQVARHAAPGAVVMQDPRPDAPDPGGARAFVGLAGLSEFYIGCIPCAGGAAVGRIPAGFQDQGSGDGGAPDRLAGPGRDGFAFAERLFGERLPHRIGEIPSEMSEAHDSVLGAVHAARQRRHQGDGGNDAHDLPGAEAEAALAGGIEGAGHRVPDQQEPGQRQHTAVEDEQHVAEHGAAARADIAEKGQHVPRRPVGVGEQAPVDGLRRRRFGQQQPRDTRGCEHRSREQDQNADTGKGSLLRQPPVCLFSFLVSCATFGAALAGTGSRNGRILRTSSAEDRTASVSGRVNSGANRKRSALMAVSSLRQPGWRGRAEGACVRRPTPARWRRWRRAVRRAGNGASRASARPLAG